MIFVCPVCRIITITISIISITVTVTLIVVCNITSTLFRRWVVSVNPFCPIFVANICIIEDIILVTNTIIRIGFINRLFVYTFKISDIMSIATIIIDIVDAFLIGHFTPDNGWSLSVRIKYTKEIISIPVRATDTILIIQFKSMLNIRTVCR